MFRILTWLLTLAFFMGADPVGAEVTPPAPPEASGGAPAAEAPGPADAAQQAAAAEDWRTQQYERPIPIDGTEYRFTHGDLHKYAGIGWKRERGMDDLKTQQQAFQTRQQEWQDWYANQVQPVLPMIQALDEDEEFYDLMTRTYQEHQQRKQGLQQQGYSPQQAEQLSLESLPPEVQEAVAVAQQLKAETQRRNDDEADRVLLDGLKSTLTENNHVPWNQVIPGSNQTYYEHFWAFMRDNQIYDPQRAYFIWRGDADRQHWTQVGARQASQAQQHQAANGILTVPRGNATSGGTPSPYTVDTNGKSWEKINVELKQKGAKFWRDD